MSGRLEGQRVLVTGAAGGIGSACLQRCREEGAIAVGSDLEGADVSCDLAVETEVEDLVRTRGPFDGLVHAGALTGATGRFPDVGTADFDRYHSVNLRGSFLLARAVAKAMRDHAIAGRLVLIGSVNSLAAEPEALPYVVSKHGMLGLVRAMAVDLASLGIAVNLIAPGPILVDRNRELFTAEPLRSGLASAIPTGSPGGPDAVAAAALFLLDPETRFVTGSTVTVDGGIGAALRLG